MSVMLTGILYPYSKIDLTYTSSSNVSFQYFRLSWTDPTALPRNSVEMFLLPAWTMDEASGARSGAENSFGEITQGSSDQVSPPSSRRETYASRAVFREMGASRTFSTPFCICRAAPGGHLTARGGATCGGLLTARGGDGSAGPDLSKIRR
jgi:hypothetical protein